MTPKSGERIQRHPGPRNAAGQTLESILQQLSPEQSRILQQSKGHTQMIAAAGSGKTRTMIALIEYLLCIQPDLQNQLLMLSFSRKAVAELRHRLPAAIRSRVLIVTFHGFCYRLLVRALRPAGHKLLMISEQDRDRWFETWLRQRSDQIGGIPFQLLYKDWPRFRLHFSDLAHACQQAFQEYKQTHRLFEYEDLVQTVLAALQAGDPAMLSACRFACVMVDEFQDTDPAQLEFLQLIQPGRLVVVGDDYQAIYGFRGASVTPFLDFGRLFQPVERFYLTTNYRSQAAIVRLANRVIAWSGHQIKKKVRPVQHNGQRQPWARPCRLSLARQQERAFALELKTWQDQDWMLLVRSNYRRQIWLKAGLPSGHVMTIHKSKGLEFDLVLLDFIDGWQTAHESAQAAPNRHGFLDEEIRIQYVGITRARLALGLLFDPETPARRIERRYARQIYSSACASRTTRRWIAQIGSPERLRDRIHSSADQHRAA
ncbi:MAG: DEAD/DEAH box helicase [Leptospiraceae bacterium]|nr:DEAD/DEAH box helicase [Leptospiraceae bacterium]